MDLIDRAAALKLLDQNGVVFRREFERLPSIDAVPLDIISKKLAENMDYPPCQEIIAECRKCELAQKYHAQEQCWKKYLKGLVEEDAGD